MELMLRRRQLMAMQSELPSAYRKVAYLARTNSNAYPYLYVQFPVVTGDTIEVVAQNDVLTSEQAFIGTNNVIEFYYANGQLKTWRKANVEKISEQYGPPDTLKARFLIDTTIDYIFSYIGSSVYRFNGKIYHVTIADENGMKKLNLIPCVRKSDSKPGMYDTVSKNFYTNASNQGEFIIPE